MRKNPEFPERQPPKSRMDIPEELMEPSDIHIHNFKSVILNWKHTLLNQITGLGGVEHLHQPDLQQVGRLAHYVTNWSAITQDQWILSMVWGYQIDFVWQSHTKSHYQLLHIITRSKSP